MGHEANPQVEARESRWTEFKAREVLSAWRQSGLSQSAFAAREGVAPQRLSWWRKRLGESVDAKPRMKLIPAVIRGRQLATIRVHASGPVVVQLPDGVVVEGSADALPAAWLGALVRELRRV